VDERIGDLEDPAEGGLVIHADPHDVEGDGVVVDVKELDVLLFQDQEDGVKKLVNLAEEENIRPPAQTAVELLHAVTIESVDAVAKADDDEFVKHSCKHDGGPSAKEDVVSQHESPRFDGLSVFHEGLKTPDDQEVDERGNEGGVDTREEGLVGVPSPRIGVLSPVVELIYKIVDGLH